MTEGAIMRGLNWLKAVQDEDGGWGNKDKDDQGNPKKTDRNAMTGMALLAYLGHCELQDSPTFGPTVQKGIDFLTSTPPDPAINGGAGSYSHPIRAYALCEAYTMTKIPKLKEYAKRASEHIVKGQNESGGWAYGYGKGPVAHTDLSVTGWNIQALKAAALTGISIDGLDEAMDKAIAYTKRCQDKTGKFAYKEGSGGKPSLTGTGFSAFKFGKTLTQKKLNWDLIGLSPIKRRNGNKLMFMNGIIMHRLVFRQQVYLADQNIGELGIKIFKRLYAEHKHQMDTGHMDTIFTVIQTFTVQL